MEFPQEHRRVPRLLDQGKLPACYAYSIAMAIETEENGQVKLDPFKFYKETVADGRQPHMVTALKYAKEKGVPIEGSKERFKIRSYRYVQRALHPNIENIHSCIQDGKAVLISIDIGNTIDFKKLTVDGVVQPRYKQMHALLGVDTVGLSGIVFANTWGEDYGRSGYGLVDLQFGGTCKGIEKGYIIFT